jgi:membrane fusion protein (multidrug efflux system)
MSQEMKKMLTVSSIVLSIIFGIYVVKKGLFIYFLSHYEMPAVTISATTATPTVWQNYLSSVGTLQAVNGTDLSSEASGIVTEIHFDSGQDVKKGDVLVTLDTAVEQAQLQNDIAQVALAQINYNRSQTLLKKNVLSQSQYDTNAAQLDEAKASMAATQARIAQKTIRAPFDGKIGIRQINIGQFVSAGTTMVTLQALDPLYVQFNLPEIYLAELYNSQPIEVTVNSESGNQVYKGTITAINAKVNQATRNILVEATIPNTDAKLYPGMFAQVKIFLKQKNNVITLPQTAISYSLHGDSVFILKPDKRHKESDGSRVLHAFRQYVKVGETRGDEVTVTDGLQAGDKVVTSGQLKLQNGTHVLIDNSVEL